MDLAIRPKISRGTKKILPKLAAMQKGVYSHFIPEEPWTEKTALSFINYSFKKQPDLFFIAKDKKNIVGYTFGYVKPWADGNHLMLEEMVVDLPFQNKGIGTLLHKTLVEQAINKYKITAVEATTYHGKDGMPMNWYEKLGWEKQDLFLILADPQKILNNLASMLKK